MTPDSPMLTPETLEAANDAAFQARDYTVESLHAFLAAQDRDALARIVTDALEAQARADGIGYEPRPVTITLEGLARLAVDALLGSA